MLASRPLLAREQQLALSGEGNWDVTESSCLSMNLQDP